MSVVNITHGLRVEMFSKSITTKESSTNMKNIRLDYTN